MRQRRWMELLEDYDFTLHYNLGKANIIADALSRKIHGLMASFNMHRWKMLRALDDFDLCA